MTIASNNKKCKLHASLLVAVAIVNANARLELFPEVVIQTVETITKVT